MIPRQKISLSLSNLLIIGSAAFLLLLLWQLNWTLDKKHLLA